MFGEESETKRPEVVVDEVDYDDFRCAEEAVKLVGGHRFRAAAGFGFGRLGRILRGRVFRRVERARARRRRPQQLVGEIHQDAVVSCGVIGERDAKLAGHEGGIAGGCEEVIEAREQLIARGVIEHEAAADARAEGEQFGSAQSLGQTRVTGENDAEKLFGSRAPCWPGCEAR